MSTTEPSPRTGPLSFIRSPQDFWGGLGLLIFAIIAWWASSNLPGQSGFAFGPGTAPRLFIMLLAINAIGIIAIGVFEAGPVIGHWSIRGPLFVLGAVLVFAVTIRPLGLVISTFSLVVVSAMASEESRWLETIIWGALLSAFCAFLFPYVLNLPMQLWPRF